ncbi:iron ABC transporter permease [Lactococcus kimchii]|uniref:iron ABC transporter permease n=1 Tax=Lactococcus sp. S-13 TaxID=2507158 RepID=UPI0010234E84|nr:iron ABC transporter permease [Lactococcus sp. S-13]RZI49723.1 iron ABC transporter permease [Lactococcus sp. S-13]
MPKKRFLTVLLSLVFSLLILSLLYLMLGNQNVPLDQLFTNKMVTQLRLPRLLSLYLTGFLLAVSGFLVQLMTRNPIAEMATLGISGGSSLALSIVLTLGLSTNDGISVLISAIGAFVALCLVMLLTARTHFQPLKVVLVGTSVGLFTTSLASSLTFASHDTQAYFRWIVGSFSGITQVKVWLMALVSLIFLLLLFIFSSQIRLLVFGDELARSLGVSVNQVRLLIMTLVALASGVTVASVGVVSFVGLIAPHIVKKIARTNFWQNIFLSVLVGMFLLVGADLIARNLFKPYEFPAGSVTMLLGAPFFLWVISKEAK